MAKPGAERPKLLVISASEGAAVPVSCLRGKRPNVSRTRKPRKTEGWEVERGAADMLFQRHVPSGVFMLSAHAPAMYTVVGVLVALTARCAASVLTSRDCGGGWLAFVGGSIGTSICEERGENNEENDDSDCAQDGEDAQHSTSA